MLAAKLAFSRIPGTITPRQFGPTTRKSGKARLLTQRFVVGLARRADFAKSGRKNDQAADTPLAALASNLGHSGRGYANDCQIDRLRQLADALVRVQALHRVPLNIDGKNRSGKIAA